MRLFKCDGKHAETEIPCSSENVELSISDMAYPKGWITITIHNNELKAAKVKGPNHFLTFCSRACLSHFLFTTEPNSEPIKERSY